MPSIWHWHISILTMYSAWRIPWTKEPGGLQSVESQSVGHDLVTNSCTLCKSKMMTKYFSCMLSYFSCVLLFVILWTLACQAPLSIRFSRKEYWNGLPCPPPWDLPDTGVEPVSFKSPTLKADSLSTESPWKPIFK